MGEWDLAADLEQFRRDGFVVREIVDGLSFEELQKLANVPLQYAPISEAA